MGRQQSLDGSSIKLASDVIIIFKVITTLKEFKNSTTIELGGIQDDPFFMNHLENDLGRHYDTPVNLKKFLCSSNNSYSEYLRFYENVINNVFKFTVIYLM